MGVGQLSESDAVALRLPLIVRALPQGHMVGGISLIWAIPIQEMRMKSALEAQQVLRWLMIVRWIALADLVLLIVPRCLLCQQRENGTDFWAYPRNRFPGTHRHRRNRGGPETLDLVVSRRHSGYHRPSRCFGWGSPNCAQSQSHPRDIERGNYRPIVDGLTKPSS